MSGMDHTQTKEILAIQFAINSVESIKMYQLINVLIQQCWVHTFPACSNYKFSVLNFVGLVERPVIDNFWVIIIRNNHVTINKKLDLQYKGSLNAEFSS